MLYHGDCLQVLPTLSENSVDAVVTDPPYGLGFMGKDWDHGVPGAHFWAEARRVAKPGAYLLAFGGTRTYHRLACAIEDAGWEIRDCLGWLYGTGFPKSANGEWGGTALKPAWEPIIMARKALDGTLAQNFARWGTGGMDIDGGRVGTAGGTRGTGYAKTGLLGIGGKCQISALDAGRWPANIIHDGSDEASAPFPDGAARFFYCAKTSPAERDAGCEHLPLVAAHDLVDREPGTAGMDNPRAGAGRTSQGRRNIHPTVKPQALMRYLIKLVTPQNGTVLDPFMGSGSTGAAALAERRAFIGIEQSADYMPIAAARIAAAVSAAVENFARLPGLPCWVKE